MKKTFTINISGSVFHIEEDAYEKLQNYLQLLNNYFAVQEGGQEILQDIESRIAELLQEKITNEMQAVTMIWVDEVMLRMGKPEDFLDAEEVSKANVQDKGEKMKKRLYRDGETRVLGGVCSGMSAYFNIDPVFLRILFVLLVFIGVGISAIIYLILWIVVPEARTTAQRLEMRGEEATISNIQKTIQDEVEEVKNSFSKINQSESVQKGKEFMNRAGQASFQLFKGLGKVVGVVFGGLLIMIGFVGFVSILISVVIGNSAIQSHSPGLSPEFDFTDMLGFMFSPGLVSVSILLLVLLLGIPLLVLLFVGTKLVFRYKTNNKAIGLGAFGIWLTALISMIILSAGQISNFSQQNSISSGKTIECAKCKTLYLELGKSQGSTEEAENTEINDFVIVTDGSEKVLAGNPKLRIEATEASEFSVIIKKTARGKNAADLQQNLENIGYNVTSMDSTLVLDPYFIIGNQAKWRNQEVQVTLKVPEGKMIRLDTRLARLNFDFDNVNNIWNKEMTGKTWKMTPEGLSLKE
jgi:phage shock protein PspC (stress-responsive transcriptional regulator)